VNENFGEINAEAALKDGESVFWHYRDLIKLRHEHEVVVEGTFDLLWPEHEEIFAYQRILNGKKLTVVANLSNETVKLPNAIEDGEVLIGSVSENEFLHPWQSFAILSATD